MRNELTIALITLGDPESMTGGYLFHRRLAALAPAHNAKIRFVSFPERPFPFAAADAVGVLSAARRTGARVIVLDSIAAAFLGPTMLVCAPSMPLVGMLHQPPGGIDFGPPRSTIQAVMDRLAYRRARLLLAASAALADELAALGIRRDRIRIVPPGRDVAPAAAGLPGDLRHGRHAALLCVGNWVERKGILTLLQAFAPLGADAATLHLVGDTDVDPRYSARVRQRLSSADLADRVIIHGKQSLESVAAFYAAADAFVLPSLKEPYGTVYGEAMTYGLPVIGWRAGNLPHLADDGREGIVVEPGDVAGLTRALAKIAEDEPFRRRLGEAARKRAASLPTWDDTATMFFGAVREAMTLNGAV